jgi:hypothetical protein
LAGVLVQRVNHHIEVISTDLQTVSRGVAPVGGPDAIWGIVLPDAQTPQGASEHWRWSSPLADYLKVLEPSKREQVELEYVKPAALPVGMVGDVREYLTLKSGRITARFYGLEAQEFPMLAGRIPEAGTLDRLLLAEVAE